MRVFFQQLINGITIGSTYALVSIGFTMVFGVLELTNFANGSLYMLGAYLSLMLYSATGMNAFLAFFISIILTGGVGYLLDRLALRRLRNKKAPKLTGLITTLGMSMIIDNTIMLAFGSETKPFPNHFDFGRIEIGSVVISWVQIIILATALTLMLILSFVVYKTKIGKAMRCTSQNAEAARLMGISVNPGHRFHLHHQRCPGLHFRQPGGHVLSDRGYHHGRFHRYEDLCLGHPGRRRRSARRHGGRPGGRRHRDLFRGLYQLRLPRCHFVCRADPSASHQAQRTVWQQTDQ